MLSRSGQRYCLARGRGTVSLGAEVLPRAGLDGAPRSGLGDAPRSGLGGTPRSGLGGTPRSGLCGTPRSGVGGTPRSRLDGTPRSGLGSTPRSGCRGSFEQGEQLASGRASNSLRAGRATRFGRGVQLASSGADNSLREGRTTRFERGVQLASGGASNSLRAGRTGCIGFTDIIRSAVRLKFSLSENLMKNYRQCRFGRGGRNRAESTTLFNCSSLKLYIRPIIFTPCRFFLSTVLLRFLILNPRQAD